MDAALQQNNIAEAVRAVRANHDLLKQIGVVPENIHQFVTEVEGLGGAAKICGAGSVAGNSAGMVLVMIDDLAALAALCARYHYDILPIEGESRGVHVV